MKFKTLFVVMAILGVFLTIQLNDALALDTEACGDWGGGCIARFEQHELGAFDAAGVWQWNITDPDLLQAIADNSIIGDNGTENWSTGTLLTPTRIDVNIDWATLRNKIGPSSGDYADLATGPVASIALAGFMDVISIPEVWKMQGEWGIYIMVAHYFKPEMEQLCNDLGWGSDECMATFDTNPETGLPFNDDGVMFYQNGTRLTAANVASITWVEKNVTASFKDDVLEHYIFMKYEMGQNILSDKGLYEGRSLYSRSFGSEAGPAAIGDHNFIITLKDGRTGTFTKTVSSNRLMPTVPSTITTTQLVLAQSDKKQKSGKAVRYLTAEVVANNMTAREITDEDGATRLLIQWAEPDLAMMLSEYSKDVRLRIYVGNNWSTPSPTSNAYFLFMDVPVTSGSVVVPPDAYTWIKDQVSANGENVLQISGMYREQFDGFHNRGYMGVITLPIQ